MKICESLDIWVYRCRMMGTSWTVKKSNEDILKEENSDSDLVTCIRRG